MQTKNIQLTKERYSKKAFTLIELLVVIAIIAILAAILFPVFARASENARRSSCQSNLKQIGLGVLQYTQDYDEFLPRYVYASGTANAKGWPEVIQPYVKSTQIFQCPSEPNPPAKTFSMPPAGGNAAVGDDYYGASDYAINQELSREPTSTNIVSVALASLTNPSQTICAMDYNAPLLATANSNLGGNSTARTAGLAYFRTGVAEGQRHLDGTNWLFTDGHVKWYKDQSANRSAAVYGVLQCDQATLNGAPTFCVGIS